VGLVARNVNRGDSVNRPQYLGYLRGRHTAARRHCGPAAPPFSFIFVAIGGLKRRPLQRAQSQRLPSLPRRHTAL